MKRIRFRGFFAVLLSLAVALSCFGVIRLSGTRALEECAYVSGTVVTTAAVNFRTAEKEDSPIAIDASGARVVVPEGTELTIKRVAGDRGLTFYNGMEGWVCLDYVSYFSYSEVFDGEDESVETPEKPKYIDYSDPTKKVDWLVVDVSRFQPEREIDWSELAAAGVKGAIIRLGGRYYNSPDASLYEDTEFYAHYLGAVAAGIKVGAYFFSSAATKKGAEEEADYALKLLEDSGAVLDWPIFIDIEDMIASPTSLHVVAGKEACTTVVESFCSRLEEHGYFTGIYTNAAFVRDLLDPSCLENRSMWTAAYMSVCPYKGDYQMWQYTANGRLSGFNGPLDVSHCYFDYSAAIGGLNDGGSGSVRRSVCAHALDRWDFTRLPEKNGTWERECRCGKCGAVIREVSPVFAVCDPFRDGEVTSADARSALRLAIGLDEEDLFNGFQADADADGEVTAEDARLILRIALGLESGITYEEESTEVEIS
ncbi:MAG: hypothetical protein K6C36_03865 [Clostridia bacterium]|nr:hypothetical protein [Clostridia bacterium]